MDSESWNEYTARYEKMSIAIRPFTMDIISALDRIEDAKILDVGCGTGSFELLMLEQIAIGNYPASVDIYASDFSNEMLQKTMDSVKRFGLLLEKVNVKPVLQNAEEEFALEVQFDIVVSSLGVAMIQKRNKAIRSIYNVLKDDGQFVFNVWERQETDYFGIIDLVYFMFDHFPGQEVSASKRKISNVENRKKFKQALSCIGFKSVECFTSFHSCYFKTFEDLWCFLQDFSPKIGKPLKELDGDYYDKIKQLVFEKFDGQELVLCNRAVTFICRK